MRDGIQTGHTDFRLPKPHRREIKRMRQLVATATVWARGGDAPTPDPKLVNEALDFLEKHAECEAFQASVEMGHKPKSLPGCATRKPKSKPKPKPTSSPSNERRKRRRAAERAANAVLESRDSDATFWRETRARLSNDRSAAIDKGRTPPSGGRPVRGGAPTLGKRR